MNSNARSGLMKVWSALWADIVIDSPQKHRQEMIFVMILNLVPRLDAREEPDVNLRWDKRFSMHSLDCSVMPEHMRGQVETDFLGLAVEIGDAFKTPAPEPTKPLLRSPGLLP